MSDPATVTVPVPPDRVVADPARLRWGTVTTVKAPMAAIARFAAWHLDLGASEINLFLDEPAPGVVAFFDPHPAIRIITCDASYWRGKPDKAQRSHQMRQAYNATACYRETGLDWLAHIDIDEFLISDRPVVRMLAETPPEAAFVRLPPAEMLASADPWNGTAHFKLTPQAAGQSRAALEEVYPVFGAHVPDGFFSYTGGKNIVRTGLGNLRIGIHAVRFRGRDVGNGHTPPGAHVGHAHAPGFAAFLRHLDFRLSRGSYRKKRQDIMELKDVVETLTAEEGQDGLRRLYQAMNAAEPDLLDRLAAHDMLLTARLDLDARVARRFGPLPAGDGET